MPTVDADSFTLLYNRGERTFRGKDLTGLKLTGSIVECDFTGAILRESEISQCGIIACNFTDATFSLSRIFNRVSFVRTDLTRAVFGDVKFNGVSFYKCSMSSCNLVDSSLENVTFDCCDLQDADFSGARMNLVTAPNSRVSGATVDRVTFIATDLSVFAAETNLTHKGGIIADWTAISRSLKSPHLDSFLIRVGMPEIFALYMIDCARALDPDRLKKLMRSTFLSYGGPDVAFALRLRDDLHRNGIQTFFFAEDAIPGERLQEVMRSNVNKYDRIIVICSESSLVRPGVQNELKEALAREARDGGASYIIPLAIDDFVFTWDDELGQALRDRVVANFRPSTEDASYDSYSYDHYAAGFRSLLQALRLTEVRGSA